MWHCHKKIILGYFESSFCYFILNRWFLFIVPIIHFQCSFVRETFCTHLCTIIKLKPSKNTSYVPLHSPVTLRCSLKIEPICCILIFLLNLVIMTDCFELLLSVEGWIAIYFLSFVIVEVEADVCLYFFFFCETSSFSVYTWALICSIGLSMNLFRLGPATFLLNSKKQPITSRYFLGLASIRQSGFLMFFPFPKCLYILPKQQTRFHAGSSHSRHDGDACLSRV